MTRRPLMTRRRVAVLLLLALGVAVLVSARSVPLASWIAGLGEWVRGRGATGVAAFVAVYVLATVAMLPASILTLAAGFAYGPVGGLLIVSPTSVLAAAVAFLLGRTVLRERVRRTIAASPRARALDRAIGRNSFKLIFLIRLSPIIPFNALNYALGLTEARLDRYVLASFIGMLPGTWMYVYLGSLAPTALGLTAATAQGGAGRLALTLAGLVATIAAVVVITRAANRALDEELRAESPVSGSI